MAKFNLGYWKATPVFRAILEIAISKPEGVSESELEEILRKNYDIEITKPELYHTLIKLELHGFLRVEHVGKELMIRLSPSFTQLLQ
ncbi:MAG: helix-turn-helix domain-containing protein [Desulfurococcaceae archaeon]